MAKENSANKAKLSQSAFYTRLLVSKRRKTTLLTFMAIFFGIFALLLFKAIAANIPWTLTAVPVVIIGSLFIMIPPTEEWEYKAWQNKQQKQERLFLN